MLYNPKSKMMKPSGSSERERERTEDNVVLIQIAVS